MLKFFLVPALFSLALVGFPRKALADDPKWDWAGTDTALQIGFGAVSALDYYQTKGITKKCREGNPILGDCGQRIPAEAYFPVMFLAHSMACYMLPQPYRRIFQGISIGVQLRTVQHNWQIGWTISF